MTNDGRKNVRRPLSVVRRYAPYGAYRHKDKSKGRKKEDQKK